MIRLMPNLKFWLTLSAVAAFTLGAIRASAASPAVSIVTPLVNQTVIGNQVNVKLKVDSFQLLDFHRYPKSKSGQGHLHLWLDQTQPTQISAIKTTSTTYTFDNVKPGNHTLLVELVNNDHSSLAPKATASVNFKSAPTSYAPNSSTLLFFSITAFLLVTAALYLVAPKIKVKTRPARATKNKRSR